MEELSYPILQVGRLPSRRGRPPKDSSTTIRLNSFLPIHPVILLYLLELPQPINVFEATKALSSLSRKICDSLPEQPDSYPSIDKTFQLIYDWLDLAKVKNFSRLSYFHLQDEDLAADVINNHIPASLLAKYQGSHEAALTTVPNPAMPAITQDLETLRNDTIPLTEFTNYDSNVRTTADSSAGLLPARPITTDETINDAITNDRPITNNTIQFDSIGTGDTTPQTGFRHGPSEAFNASVMIGDNTSIDRDPSTIHTSARKPDDPSRSLQIPIRSRFLIQSRQTYQMNLVILLISFTETH